MKVPTWDPQDLPQAKSTCTPGAKQMRLRNEQSQTHAMTEGPVSLLASTIVQRAVALQLPAHIMVVGQAQRTT